MIDLFIPGSLGLLLIVCALSTILLYGNKRLQSYGRILLTFILGVYWIFSTQLGANWLELQLIKKFSPLTQEQSSIDAQGIVVLSGGAHTTNSDLIAIHSMSIPTSFRVIETLRIHSMFPNLPIILSGGIGDKHTLSIPESLIMQKELIDSNINDQIIIIESQSQNTYEQSVNVKQILENRQIDKVILITSPTHMRRATATFNSQQINHIPSISMHPSKHVKPGITAILPSRNNLYRSRNVVKEILAFEYYKQKHWINITNN